MEKAEKYDKILNEMRELLKEKEMLKEIENQKKLLKVKEMIEENKIKKIFNVDNISYFKKYEF